MNKINNLIKKLEKMEEPSDYNGVIELEDNELFLSDEFFVELIENFNIKRRIYDAHPLMLYKQVGEYKAYAIVSILEAIKYIDKHMLLKFLPELAEYLKDD